MTLERIPPTHCPACGAPYPTDLLLDEEGARTCAACGFVNYVQLKVGAAAIVTHNRNILLLRRAHDPFKGFWGLPAGYVRWNEPPEIAVIRETKEECGLSVEVSGLLGAYFFDDDPRGNGLLLAYLCTILSGTPAGSPEASEARYFHRSAIPSSLVGSGQDQAILAWRKQGAR